MTRALARINDISQRGEANGGPRAPEQQKTPLTKLLSCYRPARMCFPVVTM